MEDTSFVKQVLEWIRQQKPAFLAVKTTTMRVTDFVAVMLVQNWPIMWSWLVYFGRLTLVVFELWLECSLRGTGSLLHLDSAACFVLLWCSVLTTTGMSGIFSVIISLGIAFLAATFLGFVPAILVTAILGGMMLWMYSSFWITGALIIIGGSLSTLTDARLAILIATMYLMYCAKVCMGWAGLVFCMNLAFITNDIFIYLMEIGGKENDGKCFNKQFEETKTRERNFNDPLRSAASKDQASRSHKNRPSGESSQTGQSAQTSGEFATPRLVEAAPSLGNEVLRILRSSDHYATLGLSRYERIDFVVLKREYRKKAILVHPDKNMGNVMAEESFKKLQIAYEVLSDSGKKNDYDEELRREELTRSFHEKIQSAAQKNGRYNTSDCSHNIEKGVKDIPAESTRIFCRKCNKSHKWIHTNRAKARARWCQDCEEYHQAKDGDGWMEYSGHIVIFGKLQKGLSYPTNTHNPTFRVDALPSGNNVVHGNNQTHGGNSYASRATNIDEYWTEEDIFDCLHMLFSKFDSADGFQESTAMRSSYFAKRNLKRNYSKRW